MAPEIVKKNGYTFSADIWSLGCLTIEMLTGRPPWSDRGKTAKAILEVLNTTTTPPPIPIFLSKNARNFLKLCL